VPSGAAGRAFVDLFVHTVIEASVTDDFVTTAWTKLSLNAVCVDVPYAGSELR